jgi:hypothetical protein
VLMRMLDADAVAANAVAANAVAANTVAANAAPSSVTRASLLAAQRDRDGKHVWQAMTAAGTLRLKPFLDIESESYSAYQRVLPS